jgi:hypothetical protein
MSEAVIQKYQGSQDGIRFGCVTFRGEGHTAPRSFQFDRLTGSLLLFFCRPDGAPPEYDHDPRRLELAKAAIIEREPLQ